MHSFLEIRYVYMFTVKKICSPYDVHPLLFRTKFFALTKFTVPNCSNMDAQRIYYLTVVQLFMCSLNLGPRAVYMLQVPRYLNPALG